MRAAYISQFNFKYGGKVLVCAWLPIRKMAIVNILPHYVKQFDLGLKYLRLAHRSCLTTILYTPGVFRPQLIRKLFERNNSFIGT